MILAIQPGTLAVNSGEVSVLFTHDMHSHLDTEVLAAGGVTFQKGGFAKLKTAIDSIRATYPDTFLFDAGDFSMGTLYQTIYATDAPELRLMGALGYDAATLGNHEFDYRTAGLISMLNAAVDSGDRLPALVLPNIDWERTRNDPERRDGAARLEEVFERYGSYYTVISKNAAKVAVFGVFGKESDEFAPESGLYFQDQIAWAKRMVSDIKKQEKPDLIVCLSHSGTSDDPDKSEDEQLAAAVPDIDLIISGHSHTRLVEPILVGSTIIASAGSNTYDLGHLTLAKSSEGYVLDSYDLISLNEDVRDDAAILDEINKYKTLVNDEYLSKFGYHYDDVLAESKFAFTPLEEFGLVQGEDALGNLISDSYRFAVKQAEGNAYIPVDVAVVPQGVVRGTFGEGTITTADAFNVSSLGIGADGVPGYPLVSVYLTGAELKTMAEVDISVSEIMPTARLYASGLAYAYNPRRLFLNRVTDVKLITESGIEPLQKEKLYRVVAGLYSCQMLGAVESKSYGLLAIVPKDKNGDPITDFEKHIIYAGESELKEWTALADYLKSFEKENGIPVIPSYYAELHNRKVNENSGNFVDLLKNPNKIFFLVLAVVLILLIVCFLILLLVIKVIRHIKRRRKQLH